MRKKIKEIEGYYNRNSHEDVVRKALSELIDYARFLQKEHINDNSKPSGLEFIINLNKTSGLPFTNIDQIYRVIACYDTPFNLVEL